MFQKFYKSYIITLYFWTFQDRRKELKEGWGEGWEDEWAEGWEEGRVDEWVDERKDE